jgi:HK97 family phage prohead protease
MPDQAPTIRSRRLELDVRAADTETREIPCVVSTDAPLVLADGSKEILEHTSAAIDLSRAPLPLIESHDQRQVNIGVVEKLKIAEGKLRGIVRFGSSARADELLRDIRDGIVTGLSIGYRVSKWLVSQDQRTLTAKRWQPFETSVVAIPADVNAGFYRSFTMTESSAAAAANTSDQTNANERALLERGAQLERQRVAAIRKRAVRGVPPALVDAAIAENLTPEQAAERFLDALVTAGGPEIRTQADVRITRDRSMSRGGDWLDEQPRSSTASDFVAAASDALLMRAGVSVAKPHDGARDLLRTSVVDMARTMLSTRGERASWLGGESPAALVTRAMTTSDFPAILSNVLGKSMRNGFENEPASHVAWVRQSTVPDFKTQSRAILGSAPGLLVVNEGGEYKDGPLTDDLATFAVTKYGRIVSLTWEALINDDLQAFARLPLALGQAARRAESDTIYGLFTVNANAGQPMQDAINLFNAAHANLAASAAAFDAAALSAGRVLLRKQTAVGGGLLNIEPRYLIVPAERETEAEQLINRSTMLKTASTEARPNDWISRLQLVVEPRLPAGGFFLAASPQQIDTVELAYLEDENGPVVEDEQNFRIDERRWKVRHVFGARFLDWRGITRVPLT